MCAPSWRRNLPCCQGSGGGFTRRGSGPAHCRGSACRRQGPSCSPWPKIPPCPPCPAPKRGYYGASGRSPRNLPMRGCRATPRMPPCARPRCARWRRSRTSPRPKPNWRCCAARTICRPWRWLPWRSPSSAEIPWRKRMPPSPAYGQASGGMAPSPALIAATPPGTFGPQMEAAALAAAEKLAAQEPGLASTLAARALAAGGQARQAAGLVKIQELNADQIKAISARLSAEAGQRFGGAGSKDQHAPGRGKDNRRGSRPRETDRPAEHARAQPAPGVAGLRCLVRSQSFDHPDRASARQRTTLLLAFSGAQAAPQRRLAGNP